MLKQNELTREDHIKLIKYCKKKLSLFQLHDLESAKLLINLGLKTIRVASTYNQLTAY